MTAATVDLGRELVAAQPGSHPRDLQADPLGVIGLGQWLLALFGIAAGCSELDQARATGPPPLAEGAGLDRQLVGGELRMLGHVVGLDLALAGLEVDDDEAPLVVAFEPIDPPGEF